MSNTHHYKATTKRVWLPQVGHFAHFTHRSQMKRLATGRRFRLPKVPATILPVDSTGNAKVNCPMDDNDTYGICGYAMADHADSIWRFRQGKGVQYSADVTKLLAQYLKASGGDNGTDETMLVGPGGSWITGIANDPTAIVVDALDIDFTNDPLIQYAIDQFYTVQMAWSVPDAFVNGWTSGSVWAAAGIPDPAKGHYTALADVGGPQDTSGQTNLYSFYRQWTWGGWDWISPTFVKSVQPQGFVAFSPQQFDPKTGLDSKGRHITVQAAKWINCGGHAIPAAVINAFPPVGPPAPPPVNLPTQADEDALFARLQSFYKGRPKILQSLATTKTWMDAWYKLNSLIPLMAKPVTFTKAVAIRAKLGAVPTPPNILQTIIQIITQLMTQLGKCGLTPAMATQRLNSPGPVVKRMLKASIRRNAPRHLWQPLFDAHLQVGAATTQAEAQALVSEARN